MSAGMTRAHLAEVREAIGAAQGAAVRYQRYAKARDMYLTRAARLTEVATMIQAQIGADDDA